MAESRFCGPGAARVLARAGAGTVVAAFGGGGYLRLPAGYVLLAPDGSPRGPLSLLVDGLRPPRARAIVSVSPTGLRVGGDVIPVGSDLHPDVPVRPARSAASTSPAAGAAAGAALARAGAAAGAALAAVAPAPSELQPGLHALARGAWAAGVRALAGLGEGLTPAGDDALAGAAAWYWATGAPPAIDAVAAERCSPIGLAYLECATRGELPPFFDGVVRAVAAGDSRHAARRAARAATWGASSGAALVWGLAATATAGPFAGTGTVEPMRAAA